MKKLIFFYLITSTLSIIAQTEEVTLDLLKNNSSDIVITKTKSIVSYKKESNRTFTDVIVEVIESIKGKFEAGNSIALTHYGGEIDGITTLVLGTPSFTMDEESVLFLTKIYSKNSPIITYKVLNGTYGKFNIGIDEIKNQKIVFRDNYEFPLKLSKNNFQTLFEGNQSVLLEDFIKKLKK